MRPSPELPDDATRPIAPPIEDVTPLQRAQGRRLQLYHRHHLHELAQVRGAMEDLINGVGSADALADGVDAMAMVTNMRRFGSLCGQQCQFLTAHHTIEDRSIFPRLRNTSEGLRKVIDRLSAEHLVIHDLLMRFAAAVKAVAHDPAPGTIAEMRQHYETLERFVVSHFGYEERELEDALGYYGITL